MAKIIEEMVVIRFCKIVKDKDKTTDFLTPELVQAIEQLAQEVVGESILVEVIKE